MPEHDKPPVQIKQTKYNITTRMLITDSPRWLETAILNKMTLK